MDILREISKINPDKFADGKIINVEGIKFIYNEIEFSTSDKIEATLISVDSDKEYCFKRIGVKEPSADYWYLTEWSEWLEWC